MMPTANDDVATEMKEDIEICCQDDHSIMSEEKLNAVTANSSYSYEDRYSRRNKKLRRKKQK